MYKYVVTDRNQQPGNSPPQKRSILDTTDHHTMSDKWCDHHALGCPYRTSSGVDLCDLCKANKCPHPTTL